jgi:hypothetical protein
MFWRILDGWQDWMPSIDGSCLSGMRLMNARDVWLRPQRALLLEGVGSRRFPKLPGWLVKSFAGDDGVEMAPVQPMPGRRIRRKGGRRKTAEVDATLLKDLGDWLIPPRAIPSTPALTCKSVRVTVAEAEGHQTTIAWLPSCQNWIQRSRIGRRKKDRNIPTGTHSSSINRK